MKRQEIEPLLPHVFRRTLKEGGPLGAFLDLMEWLHEPAEEVLSRLALYFDAASTPDRFVPYLASWVDLDRFYPFYSAQPADYQHAADPISPGTGQLRELIAAAARLSKWRGTARGLKLFLETATGIPGFDLLENPVDKSGNPRPFHIRVMAPPAAEPHIPLIERIIEQEKPAYVSYELDFKQEGM